MSAVICKNVCTQFNTVLYTVTWFFLGFSIKTPQKPDFKGTRTYVRSGSGPVRSGSGKYQSGPGPGPFNTTFNLCYLSPNGRLNESVHIEALHLLFPCMELFSICGCFFHNPWDAVIHLSLGCFKIALK